MNPPEMSGLPLIPSSRKDTLNKSTSIHIMGASVFDSTFLLGLVSRETKGNVQ